MTTRLLVIRVKKNRMKMTQRLEADRNRHSENRDHLLCVPLCNSNSHPEPPGSRSEVVLYDFELAVWKAWIGMSGG